MNLVCGVGVNDAPYIVDVRQLVGYVGGRRKYRVVWTCPYYRTWANMLSRCYNIGYQKKSPTYVDCSVCEEWQLFSNFRSWMEQQDWEGKQIDKDILSPKNRVYGPEVCVFVSKQVNIFVTERGASRGEWPIGVYWNKNKQRFNAQCNNPISKKRENLGYFTCPEEAHQTWLKRKLELARLLAEEQDDPRVANALVERYASYAL